MYNESLKAEVIKKYGIPFKEDKNGTLYFVDYTCKRCGGKGGNDAWVYTGYTCYACNGTGRAIKGSIIKLYTEEYAEKLSERRNKVLEKKSAEARKAFLANNQFNEDGVTFAFIGNTFKIKDEIKALGAKFCKECGWHINHEVEGYKTIKVTAEEALDELGTEGYEWKMSFDIKSKEIEFQEENADFEYEYEVGERVYDVELIYDGATSFETNDPYRHETVTKYVIKFSKENGNKFVWITDFNKFQDKNVGDVVKVNATIKDHKVFNGEKQTSLSRVKLL